jgi:hypothetical protein
MGYVLVYYRHFGGYTSTLMTQAAGFPAVLLLHVYQNACRRISSHFSMTASYLTTETKCRFIAFTLKS